MNLSDALQTVNFKLTHNNRAPFKLSTLANLLSVPVTKLSRFIKQGGDEYVKVTHKNGSYPEIEILQPKVIPTYLANPKFTSKDIELFKKLDKNVIFPLKTRNYPEFLPMNVYKFNEKCKSLGYTSETFKELFEVKTVYYDIGDNIAFSNIANRFVYFSDTPTKQMHIQGLSKKEIDAAKFWKDKLRNIRSTASRRLLDFDLDIEYLQELYHKQNQKCAYSGVVMELSKNSLQEDITSVESRVTSLSIDRIDSTKGYIKGNICLCTCISNMMKTSLPFEEFKKQIDMIYKTLCKG